MEIIGGEDAEEPRLLHWDSSIPVPCRMDLSHPSQAPVWVYREERIGVAFPRLLASYNLWEARGVFPIRN